MYLVDEKLFHSLDDACAHANFIAKVSRIIVAVEEIKDYGYLQHGEGTNRPFRTERVSIRNEYGDRWLAWYEGKWRRVHMQVKRLYIVFRGEKITIQIEGV